MDPSVITIIIICVMMILYLTELLPVAATSLLACLALAVFGVVPINAAFSGFGNDIVYLIAGMVVVGCALFETGVAQIMGEKIISLVGTNERVFTVALIAVTTIISLFISNTATMAVMLPIAASAIAASGGKLKKKNIYMMAGIATVVTGGLTLVGSTPQLIAQGFLQDGGYETMGFFEISKIGLPVFALMVIYFQTIGRALLQRVYVHEDDLHAEPIEPPSETDFRRNTTGLSRKYDEAPAENPPKDGRSGLLSKVPKMCVSVAILIFCIIGFVAGFWSMGAVAMVGAIACVATGCISQKRVFEQMDWTTIIIMGCSFSLSAALDSSGAGRLIAQGVVGLLGDGVSPWLLCAALALVSMLLTNFMSSTATAALLIPIAAFVAVELGYNVKSVVMATAIAVNLGFTTPISTPPITMTLSGGYRFMDYVKVGGLLNVMSYILIVSLFPIMFTF